MLFSRLRDYAMSLPEVTEQPHHEYGSFRVRGRIFVTFPPDVQHAHVFVPEEERDVALGLYPAYIEALMWGGRAVGVRIGLADADASVVEHLVLRAWQAKAPRALLAARPR